MSAPNNSYAIKCLPFCELADSEYEIHTCSTWSTSHICRERLLLFLNATPADQMIGRVGSDVFVAKEAERAVDLEQADGDLMKIADAMLTHRTTQLVQAHMLFRHA